MPRSDQSIFLSPDVNWKNVYSALLPLASYRFNARALACPISTRLLLTDPTVHVEDYLVIIEAYNAGNIEVIKTLIEDGRAMRGHDSMIFSMSCGQGKLQIVQLLADTCSSLLTPTDWVMGFVAACSAGNTDVVDYMLADKRTEPHAPANEAIMYACQGGHVEVVRLLLADPRVNLNARDDRAFDLAMHHSRRDVLKLLLEDGRLSEVKAEMARSKLEK